MGTQTHGQELFSRYGVDDIARVADPTRALYRAFGLQRGSLKQVLGPSVLKRGFQARKHGLGIPVGDTLQMPGVFLVHEGQILEAFRHETVAAQPDYEAMSKLAQSKKRARTSGVGTVQVSRLPKSQ